MKSSTRLLLSGRSAPPATSHQNILPLLTLILGEIVIIDVMGL